MKDWLLSKECGDFMAKLSGEMINNDILLEAEAHKLAAVELGHDTEKLTSLAKLKRNKAFTNLTKVFTRDSETLNDAAWDAAEQVHWAQKVDPDLAARVMKMDLESLSLEAPTVPKFPERSTFLA